MIKISCFNPFSSEIINENYFESIYTDYDTLVKNEINIETDLFIFYGISNENYLYKSNNSICKKIIEKLDNKVKIEAIEIYFDRNYELFSNLNLDNYSKLILKQKEVYLNSKEKIEEILNTIYLKRQNNSSITKVLKSHLLIRIYNEKKNYYLLDLAFDNSKKLFFTSKLTDLDMNFIHNSIDQLKNILINLKMNKEIKTKSHFFNYFRNVLTNNNNINVITILDNKNINNQKILDFVSLFPNIIVPSPSPIIKDIKDIMVKEPNYKSLLERPNNIIDTKIHSPKKPLNINNECFIIEKKPQEIITFVPPETPLNFLTNIILTPKEPISDEVLKIKLEVYNKILYQEAVKNYIKMKEYDKTYEYKQINQTIKSNILAICSLIIEDLKKY